MDRKNPIRPLHWREVLYALMFLLIIAGAPFVQDAWAQQPVTIRVLIEETCYNGCNDLLDPPDLYWDVEIDGYLESTVATPISTQICPIALNKEFSHNVDGSKLIIPVVIGQWNKNDPFPNEQCDIDPGGGKWLNVDVDLSTYPCKLTGMDVNGTCGESIWIRDIGGVESFRFTISADYPCAGGSDRCVRCLHSPIWPQPDRPVIITAESVDAMGANAPVDELQIWVGEDDDTAPTAPICSTTMTAPPERCSFFRNPDGTFSNISFSLTPPGGTDQVLPYRCVVRRGDNYASTGWRKTQIGVPAHGRAVPVVYTGVSHSRVDLAFIADKDYPQGSRDPDFLTAVYNTILNVYYGKDPLLRSGGNFFLYKQDYLNFWIAMDGGDAEEYSEAHPIPTVPDGWDTNYSFIDSGILVHQTEFEHEHSFRNIKIITARPSKPASFLHELGHFPAGLADEYCCDGQYFLVRQAWQPDPWSNIYPSQESCQADPLANGVSDACQQIKDEYSENTVPWYRVEPASTIWNDIMLERGENAVNQADARQFNWYFDRCRNGGC